MSIEDCVTQLAPLQLSGRILCHVALELASDSPIIIGQTPWMWRRVSHIVGGSFTGDRVRGEVMNSGADWALQGQDAQGTPVSQLDVRSLWRTHDGAIVYVTYGGRVAIPPKEWDEYRDLQRVEGISPTRYYFRTLPLFQTADTRYSWMNGIVTVGLGKRTRTGVYYKIFEIL